MIVLNEQTENVTILGNKDALYLSFLHVLFVTTCRSIYECLYVHQHLWVMVILDSPASNQGH